FGFVAHALAMRDGCTSGRCAALALLREPERVRANLSAQTFDRYVERYLPLWGQPNEVPLAEAVPPATGALATGQPAAPGAPTLPRRTRHPTATGVSFRAGRRTPPRPPQTPPTKGKPGRAPPLKKTENPPESRGGIPRRGLLPPRRPRWHRRSIRFGCRARRWSRRHPRQSHHSRMRARPQPHNELNARALPALMRLHAALSPHP